MFAKLERADMHLADLNARIAAYNVKNYRIVRNDNFKARQITYRLRDISACPTDIPVIIGEIVYHWRSALDHLAACLVDNPPGSTTITTECEFPIWHQAVASSGRRYPGRFTPLYGALGTTIQGKIDVLQPFDPNSRFSPDVHPLWLLHGINNIDKHRAIHVIQRVFGHGFGLGGRFTILNMEVITYTFEENCILMKLTPGTLDGPRRIKTVREWIDALAYMEIEPPTSSQVQFGPGSDQAEFLSVLDTLESIRAYIHNDVLEPSGLLAEIK